MLLLRGLPVLIQLGLLIFCLVECIQTPAPAQRNLPKWAWIVLILVVPLVGSIAWLVAGRPRRPQPGTGGWATPGLSGMSGPGRRAPRGPDDDPDFLAGLDTPPQRPAPDDDEPTRP